MGGLCEPDDLGATAGPAIAFLAKSCDYVSIGARRSVNLVTFGALAAAIGFALLAVASAPSSPESSSASNAGRVRLIGAGFWHPVPARGVFRPPDALGRRYLPRSPSA